MASSVWDDVPGELTEFGPLSSDVKPSGNFFTRLWKKNKDEGRSQELRNIISSSLNSSRESSLERLRRMNELEIPSPVKSVTIRDGHGSHDADGSEYDDHGSLSSDNDQGVSEVVQDDTLAAIQRRTLSNVLNRVGNILERRSATPQVYKDCDFRQYWMPDNTCKECYDCGDKFTTFRRRHHCRICGQIFCSKCCHQELPAKIMGYRGNLRVCTYCCKVVLSYAQQGGFTSDINLTREDLKVPSLLEVDSMTNVDASSWWTPVIRTRSILREETLAHHRSLSVSDLPKLTDRNSNPFDFNPRFSYTSADDMNTERQVLTKNSQQLRDLWKDIQDPEKGVLIQSHRVRLRTYNNCIVGRDIVSWLEENKMASRDQATAICQALQDASFLEAIVPSPTATFRDDFTLYKPGQASLQMDIPADVAELAIRKKETSKEPLWVQEIESNDDDDISISEEDKLPVMDFVVAGDLDSQESNVAHASRPTVSFLEKVIRSASYSEEGSREERSYSTRGSIKSMSSLAEPLPRQDSGVPEEFVHGTLLVNKTGTSAVDMFTCPPGWRNEEQLSNENDERVAFSRLRKAHRDHVFTLIQQLLSSEYLSQSWAEVILKLANQISDLVKPDIRTEGDDMDIRKYVQIKRIPGETKLQSHIVHGVVCTKNIAHKKMIHHKTTPRILLLKGSIEYQRIENKFNSLEPQILQEREFLTNNVARIAAVRPNILLVEKCVSRLAQEYILQAGITLAFNTKPTVMERVARFTQADIVLSMDGLVSRPALGFCHAFKVKTFQLPNGELKTLMYFDGCATHLGCTVLLRGGSNPELKRVKKILRFMTYVAYHSKLEISFCMDEFAMPRPSADEMQIQWEGLDSSYEHTEHRKPIFSPMTPLSSTVVAQIEVASYLQEKTDPLAESLPGHLSIGLEARESMDESSDVEQLESFLEMFQSSENTVFEGMVTSSIEAPARLESIKEDSSFIVNSNTCDISDGNSDSGMASHVDTSSKSDTDYSTCCFQLGADSVPDDAAVICDEVDRNGDVDKVKVERHFSLNLTLDNNTSTPCAKTHLASGSFNKPLPNTSYVPHMNMLSSTNNICMSKRGLSRQPSEIMLLTDQSDPLHSQDESIFNVESQISLTEEKKKRHSEFRRMLEEVVLTASPAVKVDIPYMETEVAAKCALKKFLPEEIYWSVNLTDSLNHGLSRTKWCDLEPVKQPENLNIRIANPHCLIQKQLNMPAWDRRVQRMLADFRARGGRIQVLSHTYVEPNERPAQESSSKESMTYDETLGDISRQRSHTGLTSSGERRLDCLDPANHQHLDVLFVSYSHMSINAPNPCIYPWVVTMEFYGRNDITLGGFLERFCFRESYRCPSEVCETPMYDHIRRFVHGDGSIRVVLRKLDSLIPGGLANILMWSWCRKCKQVTPVVPMCMDTWSMSFAKYLELRFHGNVFGRRASAEPCTHSFHHEHYQYFGCSNMVASFKFDPVILREIALPPMIVSIYHQRHSPQKLMDDTIKLISKGSEVFTCILEHMMKLKHEFQLDKQEKVISEFMAQQEAEKNELRELAQKVQENLMTLHGLMAEGSTGDNLADQAELTYGILDDIIHIKRLVAEAVHSWNSKIYEFIHQQRKVEKSEKSKSHSSRSKDREKERDVIDGVLDDHVALSKFQSSYEEECSLLSSGTAATDRLANDDVASTVTNGSATDSASCTDASSYTASISSQSVPIAIKSKDESSDICISKETSSLDDLDALSSSGRKSSQKSDVALETVEIKIDTEPKTQSKPKHETKENHDVKVEKKGGTVKNIISSFLSGSGFVPVTMPFSADEHHFLVLSDTVPVVIYDNEPSSIIAYTLSSRDYYAMLQEMQEKAQKNNCTPFPNRKPGGLIKVDSSTNLLDDTGKKGTGVLAFFRMPTATTDQSPKQARKSYLTDIVRYIPADSDNFDTFTASGNDELDGVSYSTVSDVTEKGKSSKQAMNHHMEHQFSDNSAKFYCRIYFAEQFCKLRKLLFPAGEHIYIRSLSRCFNWKAKGGKSGSAFCKTYDDRFILKQMSTMEVESFEKFAPNYFTYLTESHNKQKPTVLAKILGVYRIGFRNTHTNMAMKQDLIVMENLFYDRKIYQTFDLKGSMRNRLVNTSDKSIDELVLLDENLLKLSLESPLYVRQHSKVVLREAISRDTHFLASNLVMDYSLLVGLDENRKELVVGIIDYIRTFTWDKKLEMVVKKSGLLGGQGKMPTVVSPEIYRGRFLEAMDKYFLMVPDRWTGLGNYGDTE